jgi:exo-beta-1,3-glucanase (GH17 family)
MPSALLRPIDVFLSSPSDVQPERDVAKRVVTALNEEISGRLGLSLRLRSSESVFPDAGPPQVLINHQTGRYDVYVGIMWARFGTPTGRAGSGTEEEFRIALEDRKRDERAPRILLYFCDRPIPFPQQVEQLRQLESVLRFRDYARQEALVSTFTSTHGFEVLLRRHLVDVLWTLARPEFTQRRAVPSKAELTAALELLFRTVPWIGYSPLDLDPDIGAYPDVQSLQEDFDVLSHSPFGGVLTFGSERTLGMVPQIAKRSGMKGVIMGVYDPCNRSELTAAIGMKEYCDGYCVGHLGLREGRYGVDDLASAIAELRQSTGRPVSTCEAVEELLIVPGLIDLVDWLCPDVHPFWHEGSIPEDALQDVTDQTMSAARLRDQFDARKLVLLNMVSYPSGGGRGLTYSDQAKFFQQLLRRLISDPRLPARTYACHFSAFDNTWKRPDRGWSAAELHTGFYDLNRSPKPAVETVATMWRRR